jgi:signal transduction histidine kinase
LGIITVSVLMATPSELTDTFDDIVRALDHDLRNPVANILGFVDLLRDGQGAQFTDEQLEYLSRIEDNCRTLLSMMTRLRDLALADEEE